MIADRYDYIFIDEYQDTNAAIVCDLIHVSQNSELTLCLFGDSMQSIYSDGVGDVDMFIGDSLISIPKPDNYRCAYEVISFVNPLRLDGLEQEVAFKTNAKGEIETEESRHGFAKVLYSTCEQKPNSHSSEEEKATYQSKIDSLITKAKEYCPTAKILMLTNKAIAEKNFSTILNDKAKEVLGFDNYIKLFTETSTMNFPRMFMNTFVISIFSCIIKLDQNHCSHAKL